MSRYMTHREMSELDEIVRELRNSGEITDERPPETESEMTFTREAPEPVPFQEDFEDDGEF